MKQKTPEISLKDIPKILPTLSLPEQERLLAELERLEQMKRQKLAQERFMAFVQQVWPTFIGGRHHAKMAEAFERVARGELKRLIINMPPRHALDLQEEIPTTEGWKTMETVQPGDYVFGPDGVPTRVEGKSPVYEGDLYEVTSIDGYRVVCDADHLWTVRLHTQGKFQTYRTEDLWRRDNGGRLTTTRDGRAVFRGEGGAPRPAILPINEAAQYPHRDLPVDPYVLGVWLGDGTAKQAIITCHDDDARIIRSEIERRGYVTTDQATKFTFSIRDLKVRLRDELGVLGNKRIPEVYLTASVEQRWDLLRGLMDTDGNVSKAGQCVFSQKSRAFIGQVRELLNSLGIKNTFQTSEAKIGDRSYGETYKVSFYAKDCCFLPRKRARTKNPLHHNRARSIRIKKLDRAAKVQCLRVAREDGLFLHSRGYLTGHNTKSEFASYLLPAWFLGKYPHKKVIQASHTAELAVGFGRKVRNLVDSEVYRAIFPELQLQADSKAAGRWNTSKQGDYFAIGVGGAVTGKGADLLIIDDPHSEQEAALAETNPDIYDKSYEWYTSGPRQRLQPGGAIVIVMCMVGDTDVLMADGATKQLKDIQPGDMVASYKGGRLVAARVTNHQSSGVDNVFTVQTRSGRVVRANEEHPFLVEYKGQRKWARLKHLRPGMSLVGTTAVLDPHGRRRDPVYATHAKPASRTTGETPTRHINPWATMVGGREQRASAASPYIAEVCASLATAGSMSRRSVLLSSCAHVGSNTVTGLLPQIMNAWSLRAAVGAMYAESFPTLATRVRIGAANFVSIMTTIPERFAAFYATTVTSLWGMVKLRTYSSVLRSTYDVTADEILSIVPSGREEVFDIEVEGTENFVANGLVSHNTRWSKRDITGQVLKAAAQREGDEWEVIEFPAILPSGKPLWPEFWSLAELTALRNELPHSKWMAQYQQNPTSDTSAIVKREWWKTWESERPPKCEFLLQSWDTAFEKTQRADYSACTTWGVFYKDDDAGVPQANIILMNAFRERMEFPKLKRTAFEEYKEWEPDSIIVEKKASGAPLIYELRSMGVPVQEFTPSRGNDKISRLNAVSDLFASGRVWAPNTHWAEEVIDEVASFPSGEHDDYVDSVSMALMRFRQGGYISTNMDEPDDIRYFKSNRNRGYY